MFANCVAYGGVGIFFRILASVGLIFVPYTVWKTAKDVVNRLSREYQTRNERWTMTKQEIINKTWFLRKIVAMTEHVPPKLQNVGFMVGSIMGMFFLILFIELKIKWNHFNNLEGFLRRDKYFRLFLGYSHSFGGYSNLLCWSSVEHTQAGVSAT